MKDTVRYWQKRLENEVGACNPIGIMKLAEELANLYKRIKNEKI